MTGPSWWKRALPSSLLAASGLLLPASVRAHTDLGDVVGSLASGLAHPFFGLDHVAAMVAVGIWGAQLGSPALWVLPVAFPLVMALGGAAGALGVPLPGVDIGIAASAIVLGAMIALAARPPLTLAFLVVAVFAICHGHTHGALLPASTAGIGYSAGFVLATGALHGLGMLFGLIKRWAAGRDLMRLSGVLIAFTGLWFLLPHLSG